MFKLLRKLLRFTQLPWRKPINRRQSLSHIDTEKQKHTIDKRKSTIKRRKNFFLSLIIIITLWLLLASTIVFVSPEKDWVIGLFFGLVFASLTFTFSFLFINSRLGLIVGMVITLFLILRYFGIGTLINALLLLALAGVTEYYFRTGT